jgi:hypothetical protein
LYTSNYSVRVVVHSRNRGASAARNTGLVASSADWVLLLDDDVKPEPHLLDAYIGATLRYPNAAVLVGHTQLPVEDGRRFARAIKVAGVAYMFGVAQHLRHPPWGVTANLCVRGRTRAPIYFGHAFPRTGGGEDIDFCLRLKSKTEDVVAVPAAVVHHPWWGHDLPSNLKHVVGWAKGDSLCIGSNPSRAFLAAPNWLEFLLLMALVSPWLLSSCAPASGVGYLGTVVLAIPFVQVAMLTGQHWQHCNSDLVVSVMAAMLLMAQDTTRAACHLARGDLHRLCLRFDWFDGQSVSGTAAIRRRSFVAFAVYCAVSLGIARAFDLL